jgi:hypothetical protein
VSRPRYVKHTDPSEWLWPVRRGYLFKCCDCGLVHRLDFRLVTVGGGRQIEIRVARDERKTAAGRRSAKLRKHIKKRG